jgi:hypothetical protein
MSSIISLYAIAARLSPSPIRRAANQFGSGKKSSKNNRNRHQSDIAQGSRAIRKTLELPLSR